MAKLEEATKKPRI